MRPWAPLLLVLCVVGIYAGRLDGPLLFDDEAAILENESIRTLWPITTPLSPPQDTSVAGRPIPNLTLAITYAISGLSPTGFHLGNLVLHAGCTLLLLGILRRLFALDSLPESLRGRAEGLALAASLLWAVHPLHTETVLYATQRTEVTMALFYLATLYFLLRRWSVAAVVSCAIGMGCKAVMVTAPVLFFFFDRAFLSGSFAATWRERRKLHLALAATWIVQLVIQLNSPRGKSVEGTSLDYLGAQVGVVWHYLKLSLWPGGLVYDYGPLVPGQAVSVLGAGLLAALVLVALFLTFKSPRAGYAGAWLFGILAPTSSFVTIHTEVGTERRMYLPLIALVVVIVIAVHLFLQARLVERAKTAGLALAALVAVVLGVRSFLRTEVYQDATALWEDAVVAWPANPRAHYNLSERYLTEGRKSEAEPLLRAAIELQDTYTDAHKNLGALLASDGRVTEALPHLETAARLRPSDASLHFNLGLALLNTNQFQRARSEMEEAVRLDPSHQKATAILQRLRSMPTPPQ